MDSMRIGYGYDVHKLVPGRPLVLGGVSINHPKGLLGHSDADVLLHAITDALLGSLAMGDIGTHFPDDDAAFKNIDSRELLRRTAAMMYDQDYRIHNIDATVVAQQPKLAPHIKAMRTNIATDLSIDPMQVSVKATTSEELGFEGEQQGISVRAVVLVSGEAS